MNLSARHYAAYKWFLLLNLKYTLLQITHDLIMTTAPVEHCIILLMDASGFLCFSQYRDH